MSKDSTLFKVASGKIQLVSHSSDRLSSSACLQLFKTKNLITLFPSWVQRALHQICKFYGVRAGILVVLGFF